MLTNLPHISLHLLEDHPHLPPRDETGLIRVWRVSNQNNSFFKSPPNDYNDTFLWLPNFLGWNSQSISLSSAGTDTPRGM